MTHFVNTAGRMARRIALPAVSLLVAASGTATAHGRGYSGGMMGGGWGLLGGGMGLWGFLWMGLLFGLPLLLAYLLLTRGGGRFSEGGGKEDRPLSILRERYARGEIDDDEFERRREQIERAE